ncbi:MAG TPA: hypothetical protein VIY48_15725 [Candidatus Paceibacterota bacterium]
MSKQTIKAARFRLDRFQAKRVYSFEIGKSGVKRRAGVYKIGA